MSTTPTRAKRRRQVRTASKTKVPLPPQLQRVNLNAAGIDIGSEEHWAAVLRAAISKGRTCAAYFRLFSEIFAKHGLPQSIYCDRHSILGPEDTGY
jgi:hypothetical protein